MRPPLDSDNAAEAEMRVGRTLRNKWHLDTLIDVGGMAAVYAATHRNGNRGAVKILHRHRSEDPDIAARFRREGYIANKVSHPNALSVLDDDVDDDGSVFLVMELLEGATLGDRAAEHGGKLPADEVLLMVDQLLDVLAVAHDMGIVHRDVKPDNVLVTADGQVKILDFGIARLAEPSEGEHSGTMAGVPMGSPAFMSPEQARGRWDLVDAQSDVWSVGATMFTLLSGQDVHAADTVPELLAAIFTEPARSLKTVLPEAHASLAEVVDRALRLRLADRWADARAMKAAVRNAYLDIFGSPLPVRVWDVRAGKTISQPEIRQETNRTPPREATTSVPPAASVARSYWRPAALASSVLLAAALSVAAAEGTTISHQAHGAQLAELGEAPARPSLSPATAATAAPIAVPTPAAIPAPVQEVSAPPAARPTFAGSSSAAPVVRARYPSIYDSRR